MRNRRILALILCGSGSLAPGQDVTFSTDVKVVNLLATVTTKKGAIVRDLGKEDFSLAENGHPQAIKYFARESDLPLTLGLMVDTSMSQRNVIDAERTACFHFLDQVLRADKDKVFVMQFDMGVQLRQRLTSSRRELDESLSFVSTPTRRELQSQFGGGTLLYDAVVKASDEVMSKLKGRKALIVLSDGGENGSQATLAEAIDAAERADTLIYSILFGGSEGRGILMRMSRETGGGYYEVDKKLGIEQVFGLIEEELRSQYSIGYVTDRPIEFSEFRKIQLAAKQKGLVVRTRDRYWAQR
jgi:VWFA-related protein